MQRIFILSKIKIFPDCLQCALSATLAFYMQGRRGKQNRKGTHLAANCNASELVRFGAFRAVKNQVEVCWVVTPGTAVSGYQSFKGICCLHLSFTLNIYPARTSEAFVSYRNTTGSHKPEDSDSHADTEQVSAVVTLKRRLTNHLHGTEYFLRSWQLLS
jgi:hypothetical protein